MADLTKQVSITTSWTEITAPLGMADGSSYLVDVDGVDSNATVYSAETDTAVAPGAAVIGHALVPANFNRSVDSRIYSKRTDVYLWVRVTRGNARIVSTPTGV